MECLDSVYRIAHFRFGGLEPSVARTMGMGFDRADYGLDVDQSADVLQTLVYK